MYLLGDTRHGSLEGTLAQANAHGIPGRKRRRIRHDMPIRVARDRVATPKHLERREGIERGRETAHPRLVGSHDARAHTRKAAGKRVKFPALALKRAGQRVEQALLSRSDTIVMGSLRQRLLARDSTRSDS